jgi:hypothetical protein
MDQYPSQRFLKKVVFNRLKHHIGVNNILGQEKRGFRTKSATDTATFTLISKILLALN